MFDRYLTSVEHKPTTNLCDMKDKHEEYDLMVFRIDGWAMNVLRGDDLITLAWYFLRN